MSSTESSSEMSSITIVDVSEPLLPFYDWCVLQMNGGRKQFVYDLEIFDWITDSIQDPRFPWSATCQEIHDYLQGIGGDQSVIDLFSSAWELSGRKVVIDYDDDGESDASAEGSYIESDDAPLTSGTASDTSSGFADSSDSDCDSNFT